MAAKDADMSLSGAHTALRSPEVQAAVWREQMYILRVQGVPAAVKALIDVATSLTARDSARVMASDKILQHAKEVSGGDGKSIDQMTVEEMDARLAELRAERAANAKFIDAVVLEPEPEEPGALD